MKSCCHVRFRSHCGQELLTERISRFEPKAVTPVAVALELPISPYPRSAVFLAGMQRREFITLLGGAIRGKGLVAGLAIAIFLASGRATRMVGSTPIFGRLWNA